jgi:hypothetical protein
MATRFDVTSRPFSRAGHAAFALAIAVACTACGGERTYTAEPIAARIVDAETGLPVEGVNVVAAWQAKGGLEGGNIMGYVNVMEDVTNANGEFSFPAWGPKKWRNGAIRDGAPLLILLKPTYEVRFLWEMKYGVEFAPSHLSSSWNGKTIHIKKFERANDEYSQSYVRLWTVIDTLVAQPDCAWRGIPRFLNAVDRQRHAILSAGESSVLSSLDALQDNVNKSCGSLKAVVLEGGQ